MHKGLCKDHLKHYRKKIYISVRYKLMRFRLSAMKRFIDSSRVIQRRDSITPGRVIKSIKKPPQAVNRCESQQKEVWSKSGRITRATHGWINNS